MLPPDSRTWSTENTITCVTSKQTRERPDAAEHSLHIDVQNLVHHVHVTNHSLRHKVDVTADRTNVGFVMACVFEKCVRPWFNIGLLLADVTTNDVR